MTQRMIEITSPSFITEESLAAGDLEKIFTGERPLALEIGCGIGDFIVQMAKQQPETDFLAIDIYNKGCHKTCKKVDASQLDNVRVARLEARYLLTRYLPRESLSAIYINCPDPWPKKRHRDRRLVNREFLQLAFHSLQSGGELYFSTDFDDYAEQVAGIFPTLEGYRNCLSTPYALELPGYPISKYMRRFLDLGQPIHFVHYRKKEGCAHAVPLPIPSQGFRVRWSRAENE